MRPPDAYQHHTWYFVLPLFSLVELCSQWSKLGSYAKGIAFNSRRTSRQVGIMLSRTCMNGSSCRGERKCASSWRITYSNAFGDFFANSRLIQTWLPVGLQLPHFVFILRIPQLGSLIPSVEHHFLIIGAARFLKARRCQLSRNVSRCSRVDPSGLRRKRRPGAIWA